jgi:hypothetical protein
MIKNYPLREKGGNARCRISPPSGAGQGAHRSPEFPPAVARSAHGRPIRRLSISSRVRNRLYRMSSRPKIRLPKTWSPSLNALIERAYQERNPDLLRHGRGREVWVLMTVVVYRSSKSTIETAAQNREMDLLLCLLEYLQYVQINGIPAEEISDPCRKQWMEIGAERLIADGWIPKLATMLAHHHDGSV